MDLAERADHDVVGLQVAVEHAALVRVGHGVEHMEGTEPRPEAVAGVDGSPGRRARLVDVRRAPASAAHELHGVDDGAVGPGLERVHRHDARVLEARGGARLEAEAARGAGVVGEVGAEPLQRHLAPEVDVLGAQHLAHGAFAEELDDAVALAHGRDDRTSRLGRPCTS
ncbi:MAG: hypothetical protein U1F43_36350 [Myxococcota bacterium]